MASRNSRRRMMIDTSLLGAGVWLSSSASARAGTSPSPFGHSTSCNFDYSGAVTETILLGNVAYRCQKKIDWDPVNLKIPNAPEAERFLRRDYRVGRSL